MASARSRRSPDLRHASTRAGRSVALVLALVALVLLAPGRTHAQRDVEGGGFYPQLTVDLGATRVSYARKVTTFGAGGSLTLGLAVVDQLVLGLDGRFLWHPFATVYTGDTYDTTDDTTMTTTTHDVDGALTLGGIGLSVTWRPWRFYLKLAGGGDFPVVDQDHDAQGGHDRALAGGYVRVDAGYALPLSDVWSLGIGVFGSLVGAVDADQRSLGALSAGLSLSLFADPNERIPRGRFGVDSVVVEGAEQMDPEALASCLGTRERSTFSINFGRTAEPECNVPPFDAERINIGLFRWPWTEWPLFDRTIFERDIDRAERWYRARGYYDAHVLSSAVDPPEALERRIAGGPTCVEDCEVDVEVAVHEGDPVLIRTITVDVADPDGARVTLDADLMATLRDAIRLEMGDRFDENAYDRSLASMRTRLADASYAHGGVTGRVEIDRTAHTADVKIVVTPGPSCTFGPVTVEQGNAGDVGGFCEPGNLVQDNADVIVATSLIRPGQPFSSHAIASAQNAVYGLGAFSSVDVEAQADDPRGDVIPVVIRAVPGRTCRFGLGAGVQAGARDYTDASAQALPEWDLHGLAFVEFRNFLGGLRRLRIEERPRLIMSEPAFGGFPGQARLGNEVRLTFGQPGFVEPRTTLAVAATWDLGPDPFAGFFRHDLDGRIGPERRFWDQRLFAALRLRENVLFPLDEGDGVPSRYHVMFLEEALQLDLRDNPREPRNGAYFAVSVHEAGFFMPASWDYVRVTPEARGYVELPVLSIVLAARFAVGALFVFDPPCPWNESFAFPATCGGLDGESAILGPQRYRLRAGGANSNRGYLPGALGDSDTGGLRRWEGSLELRVPVTENINVVPFLDVGDVHAGRKFRFDYLHLSLGLGLRWRTIVGPVRFDVGWQVPEMRVVGVEDATVGERAQTKADLLFFDLEGAVHITIGEAF